MVASLALCGTESNAQGMVNNHGEIAFPNFPDEDSPVGVAIPILLVSPPEAPETDTVMQLPISLDPRHPHFQNQLDVGDPLTSDQETHTGTPDGDVMRGQLSFMNSDSPIQTVTNDTDLVNGLRAMAEMIPANGNKVPVAELSLSPAHPAMPSPLPPPPPPPSLPPPPPASEALHHPLHVTPELPPHPQPSDEPTIVTASHVMLHPLPAVLPEPEMPHNEHLGSAPLDDPSSLTGDVNIAELPPALAAIPDLKVELLNEADYLLANLETHTHQYGLHPLLPIHPDYDKPHSHPPYQDPPVIDLHNLPPSDLPDIAPAVDPPILHPTHDPPLLPAIAPLHDPHIPAIPNQPDPHHVTPIPNSTDPHHPTPVPHHPDPLSPSLPPHHPTSILHPLPEDPKSLTPHPFPVKPTLAPHHGHLTTPHTVPHYFQAYNSLHPLPAPHSVTPHPQITTPVSSPHTHLHTIHLTALEPHLIHSLPTKPKSVQLQHRGRLRPHLYTPHPYHASSPASPYGVRPGAHLAVTPPPHAVHHSTPNHPVYQTLHSTRPHLQGHHTIPHHPAPSHIKLAPVQSHHGHVEVKSLKPKMQAQLYGYPYVKHPHYNSFYKSRNIG